MDINNLDELKEFSGYIQRVNRNHDKKIVEANVVVDHYVYDCLIKEINSESSVMASELSMNINPNSFSVSLFGIKFNMIKEFVFA